VIVTIGFLTSDQWARKLIYPWDSSVTQFPGDGQATIEAKEQLWIVPKEDRRPFFAPPEEKTNYSTDLYDIIQVPAQTQLAFAVGKVEDWEDIADSDDKYLVLNHFNPETVEAYRVAFESNDFFGSNQTELVVEKVGWPYFESTHTRSVLPKVFLLSEIGFSKAKQIIRKGDTVVILPVYEPPVLSKRDKDYNYLAAKLFIRRLGR
jgi:hypothetical protein